MKTRVLLVGGNGPLRSGLERLLGAMPEVEPAGVAEAVGDPSEAARRFAPDVLVLTVGMDLKPHLDRDGRLRALRACRRVVVLCFHDQWEIVSRLLDAGAGAYVLMDRAASELPAALAAMLDADTYVSSRVRRPTGPAQAELSSALNFTFSSVFDHRRS
jgi:DNA-binding NarL/FixJ family response regulator